MAVAEQPVEDGGGDDGIAEHGSPFADRAVGGDQHAATRVTARDELEEEMGGVGVERQIAEFVDDQELGLGEEAEPLLEPALGMRLGEACGQSPPAACSYSDRGRNSSGAARASAGAAGGWPIGSGGRPKAATPSR